MNHNERTAFINKYVLIVIDIICVSILFGNGFNYFQGTGSEFTVTVIGITTLAVLLISGFIYFRNKESEALKHVSAILYLIAYAIILFVSNADFLFIIIFPVSVVYILYYDLKMVMGIAGVAFAINVADVIYIMAFLGKLRSGAPILSTDILVRLLGVFLYALFFIMVTSVSKKVNETRIAAANEAKEKTDAMLKDILSIAATVKENSSTAGNQISELVEYINSTASELDGISESNSTNSSNIEKQTVMTGNIQNMIQETKDMSDEMLALAKKSLESVDTGKESVIDLQTQARRTAEANEQIVESVSNLIDDANVVGSMTSQISAISGQTNLLALNASIESARAGEAGKGFGVVAEEIGKLADETKQLTDKIQDIVNGLQKNAEIAKEKLELVMENSQNETVLISNVEQGFSQIGSDMEDLGSNITNIHDKIDEVLHANESIVESINDISAVSEEVSTSTLQAVALGNETMDRANEAKQLMSDLINVVSTVDKYNRRES